MKWGIISASKIANKFIQALQMTDGMKVCAIASRNLARADEYKNQYNIDKAYGNYDELFADKSVEVVYISNLNNQHFDTVMRAIESGKHVVCEKPLSVSYDQALKITEAASQRSVFLAEALWTRFMPVYKDIHDLISKGVIGEVMQVRADFSFVAQRDAEWRLLNADMGGGALYDIGIYSIMFILDFLGTDLKNVNATGFIGDTGVDEESVVTLNYGSGKIATTFNSFISNRPRIGTIIGTKGQITVPDFYSATCAQVSFYDGRSDFSINTDTLDNKFIYEVKSISNDIFQGKKQSEFVPLSHSVCAARIIESAINQIIDESGKE